MHKFPLLPLCWQAVFYHPTAFPMVFATLQFFTSSVVVNQRLASTTAAHCGNAMHPSKFLLPGRQHIIQCRLHASCLRSALCVADNARVLVFFATCQFASGISLILFFVVAVCDYCVFGVGLRGVGSRWVLRWALFSVLFFAALFFLPCCSKVAAKPRSKPMAAAPILLIPVQGELFLPKKVVQ